MSTTPKPKNSEIWSRASELTDLIHERESLENKERHKRQQIMELLLMKRSDKEETPYGTVIIATRNEYQYPACLLYTSPSPRDATLSRMPSSA